MVLIAAYICGINKESFDIRLFGDHKGPKAKQP